MNAWHTPTDPLIHRLKAMTPHYRHGCAVALVLAIFATPVHAALPDEIQVYTDDINEPGERGLELHLNTTPKNAAPTSYAGEVSNLHGVRVTPEFSYGLTRTTDVGLYVPTVLSSDGRYELAGLKMRFKWLPIQSQDTGGFFAGVNFELGQVQQKYAESRRGGEVRNILGWRSTNWLIAVNPIFEFDASPGFSHTPSLEIGTKINRRINEHLSIGWERYHDRGPYNHALPYAEQGRTNYVVLDYEGPDFDVNFGIGKGNYPVTDQWTVKTVIGYSFGK